MFIRSFTLVLLLAVTALTFGCASKNHAGNPSADGVFIHIKSGNEQPHAVLMGLQMARMMSASRDVMVYFDVDGIEVILTNAEPLEMRPFGSSKVILQELIERGVRLQACPGCLRALGHTPEQLMDGIVVADKEAFFEFTRGRILSLSY